MSGQSLSPSASVAFDVEVELVSEEAILASKLTLPSESQPVRTKTDKRMKKVRSTPYNIFRSIANCGSFYNRISNQRGIAIVLSLLILFLLVTLILDLDYNTRADLRSAGNFRDDQKAYLLAQSAVNAARAVIMDDRSPKYDALTEFWAMPLPAYAVGDGVLTGAITDEMGKFNLNSFGTTRSVKMEQNKKILQRLFELLEVDPYKVDAIIDWVDKGDDPLTHGAEEGYYQSLDPPYQSKNGQMDTLSELHRIKGFDDKTYRAVAPYLTVYGNREIRTINMNTASPYLIQALDEGIDENQAERVIENRPWESKIKLKPILGDTVYANIQELIDIKSFVFSIKAEGKVNDTIKLIQAVVKREKKNLTFLYYRVE